MDMTKSVEQETITQSTNVTESNNLSTLYDRSLADMLASAFSESINDVSQSNTMQSATDPSASHDTDELPDSCIQLESQLLSASIRIDGLTDENQRLHNQIQLLEDEIDNYRKTQQRLQHHVKKITATNDDLRREISRQKGLRKFVEPVPTPEPTAQAQIDTANEELGLTKAKLVSLKEEMVSLATAMVATLGHVSADESQSFVDNTGFTSVERRRRGRAAAHHSTNATPSSPPQSPATTRPEAPQRIEVITSRCAYLTSISPVPVSTSAELHRHSTTGQAHPQESHQRVPQYERPSTYRDALHPQTPRGNLYSAPQPNITAHPTCTSSDTVLIGTSLTRGGGAALHNHGIDVTTYTYAGTHIRHIRSRLKGIFNPSYQPQRVILQCRGNDLEAQPVDRVVFQYECLINDVRRLCPNARIIVNKIPLRRGKASILRKITAMNAHLEKMSNVQCIDACPKALEYFRRDMVHFNKDGIQQYAATLARCLESLNFHQDQYRLHM